MKIFYILAFLLCTLCSVDSTAKEYKVEDVPMVHLKDRTKYVSNPDGILSAYTVSEIDDVLFRLEQKTGIQVAVVVVEQIEGGDCFDFAYNIGRTHGVGQDGKDNGLVVLLSTNDRCVQFATGYGLEGVLTDAACKKIQTRYMNDAFSKGNWDDGMRVGMKAIYNTLINETGNPDKPQRNSSGGNILLIALIGTFAFTIFYLWFSIRRRNRCPKCHKHTLKKISSRTIEERARYHIDEVVYCCSNCGHIVKREVRINDDTLSNGGGGIFMGGGGFSGGDGGFSGGSFGGGDFGGGGAGSKF